MKHSFETEMENRIGRICGAVFEAIVCTLSEEQEAAARDVLRRVVANPDVYRDDKRILAIIAGCTDDELERLMTKLYGPRPNIPNLRIIKGGNNNAA